MENIVSTTHHIVRIEGDKVIKTARDNSTTARQELLNDYEYLTIMGYEVSLEGNSLIMPFIGNPLDSLHENIEQLLQILEQVQTTLPLPQYKKKLGKSIYKTTKQKLVERLGEEDLYQVRERTKAAMKTVRKILNKKTPTVISHTDSHAKNFLKDENGTIHLIDWESSIAGLPEFDLAVLESYLLVEYYDDLITQEAVNQIVEKFIKPRVEDNEAYDCFLCIRLMRQAIYEYSIGNILRGDKMIEKSNSVILPYQDGVDDSSGQENTIPLPQKRGILDKDR